MTENLLQDALAAYLRELFRHYRLKNSIGEERSVNVFLQDVPIRKGIDETLNSDELPEPYIVVRTAGGELPEPGEGRTVRVILVICVCDQSRDRQGHRDVLHIIHEISLGLAQSHGVVGGKFCLQYPITWETQVEDAHPCYFAAMALTFTAAAIYQEEPDT